MHHNKRNFSMNGFVSSASACTKRRATCSRGPKCRCLQQGTDCLCTVAHRLLGQLKIMCEPPLEKGAVQRAAVQVLDLGEIGQFLQTMRGMRPRMSQPPERPSSPTCKKPDEALGECWNIVRRHAIQCLQVRGDAVQDHGVA